MPFREIRRSASLPCPSTIYRVTHALPFCSHRIFCQIRLQGGTSPNDSSPSRAQLPGGIHRQRQGSNSTVPYQEPVRLPFSPLPIQALSARVYFRSILTAAVEATFQTVPQQRRSLGLAFSAVEDMQSECSPDQVPYSQQGQSIHRRRSATYY